MSVRYVTESAEAYAHNCGVRLLSNQVPMGVPGGIEITDLYADTPGQGNGTQALQNLCDLADEYGHNLYLHPESERNKAFYARFGFVREVHLKYQALQLVRYHRKGDEE